MRAWIGSVLFAELLTLHSAAAQEGVTLRPLRFEAFLPAGADAAGAEPAPVEIPARPEGLMAPAEALRLQFHCELLGLTSGQTVQSVWIAEDLGTIVPPGTPVDSAEIAPGTSHVEACFSLKRPETGWPPGRYRLEIRVAGKVLYAERFSIQ
jgi:hypothetical protein